MESKIVLITGSSGLVGSEAARFFGKKGFKIIGIDNDMRQFYFGKEASTKRVSKKLSEELGSQYKHYTIDIRDFASLEKIFKAQKFNLIIHTAAQPSHDWATKEPMTDFQVNALATHYLLELTRLYSPKAVFIFTSTNKVYGDLPNFLPLVEKKMRYEVKKGNKYYDGIDESMSIDNSKHSIFGASKVAADIMAQEYGKYFGLKTGIFRCGCITGPAHSGAILHGFLAYLVKCIREDKEYTIFGYKGKQVRDNIHSYDLVNAFYHFYKKPNKGEVYNLGGSHHSNISILEVIQQIEKILKKKAKIIYSNKNRNGDHIWYVSNVSKFKKHYPDWEYKYDTSSILRELCQRD